MSDQVPLPTIDQFTEELVKEPNWYNLGVFLGVPTYELDVIARDYHLEGTQRRLIELFKYFQSHGKVVSWNDIVDALTRMQHKDLADQLHQKYIQTTASSHLSPTRSEKQDCEEARNDSQVMDTGSVSEVHDNKLYIDKKISKDFDEVITAFANLVLETKRALQRNTISIPEIQVVLQEIYEIEPLSTEEATLDKVFSRMRQHYCFLNYRVLAYLIDMFLSNEKPLQQLLVDYTNKLEKFKESVVVKDLMKLIKEKRDSCSNHKIVQLKVHDFWGKVILKKFERLAQFIFDNLYDCAAQIRIEDGCICVSWIIPDIDASELVTVSPDLLKVVGVISLKIDDKVLYDEPHEGCHILESAFLQAVEVENVRAVELLLAVGCDSNMYTPTGEVAITSALKLRNSEGLYLLHFACINGHTDVVHTLLKAGSSPEVTTNHLETPLILATQNGHNEVVELLLKTNVDPNACSEDGRTAIFMASWYGHSVVISTLLTSGADPNLADSDGCTPLIIGSCNGHSKVVELLLEANVDPNACLEDGTTAIFMASKNGHSVIVSVLLKSGADPNLARINGCTPLIIGSLEGHNKVVELLVEAKVDSNACLENESTAIYIASENGHSLIVSALLRSGADPNLATSDGWTPLMIGCKNGHNEVIELLLLNSKVDLNACNNNRATALYLASQIGNSIVVSTLLNAGADPNIKRLNGLTPLMIASGKGHTKVVKQLIEHSDNYHAVAALHLASQYGHIDIVRILHESGADSRLVDSEGKTAVDCTGTTDTSYDDGEVDTWSVITEMSDFSDIEEDVIACY